MPGAIPQPFLASGSWNLDSPVPLSFRLEGRKVENPGGIKKKGRGTFKGFGRRVLQRIGWPDEQIKILGV